MENMVRPENIARLTVTHKPTMFRYKDLMDNNKRLLSVRGWRISAELRECSHFGMTQGFAGDVALHLGLINGIDWHPHYAATHCNCPESVSLKRIRVKTVAKIGKKYHNILEKISTVAICASITTPAKANVSVYSLKGLEASALPCIFPNICQASLQNSSATYDGNKSSKHDHHLKHIRPDDGFQSPLKQNPQVQSVHFHSTAESLRLWVACIIKYLFSTAHMWYWPKCSRWCTPRL